MEFIFSLIPNVIENFDSMMQALIETIQMLVYTGLISAVLGIILGVILVVCRKDGLLENIPLWWILDKFVNLFRCIPFILLVTLMIPFTRMIVGTSIFVIGSIPPLVAGTVPFFARQVESSLLEVDPGLIEASKAMGDSPFQTMTRVYLKESIPSLIRGISITLIALIGNTTICGALGAGGLGQFAYNHGHVRGKIDVTIVTIIILLLLTTVIQSIAEYFYRKTSH